MPTLQTTKRAELAQARAAAYGLIAFGFQYPERAALETLADPARWKTWPDVLRDSDKSVSAPLYTLGKTVKAVAARAIASIEELQQCYDTLFGHAVRGSCPAYEMEYGRNEIIRQASDLADLAGFYRAFGLEIADDANGRPDHITTECEFMSALCVKEAHASAQNDAANVDICINAQRAFLRDHLARWLPAFAHRVRAADAEGLFCAVAGFADAHVKAECARFDIHAGPPTLELKPPDPVLDTQVSCGPVDCGEGRPGEFVQLGVDPRVDENP